MGESEVGEGGKGRGLGQESSLPNPFRGRGGQKGAGVWEAILDGKGEDVGEPGGFCGRRVSQDLHCPGLEDMSSWEPCNHPKEPELRLWSLASIGREPARR